MKAGLFGSCRYQNIFFPHSFPPRLYSLKEVHYLLSNFEIYKTFFNRSFYENEIFKDCADIMLGDSCHGDVLNQTTDFFQNSWRFFSNSKYYVEVSSLDYARKGNAIASAFYYKNSPRGGFRQNYLEICSMESTEILESIQEIHKLLEKMSNRKAKLILFSHADLSISRENSSRIHKRIQLAETIKNSVATLQNDNVLYLDIWKDLRSEGFTLGDIFCDKYHLNQTGERVLRGKITSSYKSVSSTRFKVFQSAFDRYPSLKHKGIQLCRRFLNY